MFSSWWSGEKKAEAEGEPAAEAEAGDEAAADPGDVAAVAKEAGKAALDGFWNVASKVASTVSSNSALGVVTGVISDFSAEEEKFKRKKQRHTDASVPPWVGYNEEESMRTQILALSTDKRNFLRNPPAGVQFHFDFAVSFPVATSILEEDPMLEKMRFELVPKQVTEEIFWRNYFYRVSLIKQSSQLSTLAAQQNDGSEPVLDDQRSTGSNSSEKSNTSAALSKSSSGQNVNAALEEHDETEEAAPAEFISDDFVAEGGEDVQEWEKELHQELKDLGMDENELDDLDAEGGDVKDDAEWEREIQAMLDMEEPAT